MPYVQRQRPSNAELIFLLWRGPAVFSRINAADDAAQDITGDAPANLQPCPMLHLSDSKGVMLLPADCKRFCDRRRSHCEPHCRGRRMGAR